MIKYTVQNDSPKGKYTYEYFDLKKLEVDSYSAAQGIEVEGKIFSPLMSKDIIKEIQDLLCKTFTR